MQTSEPEVPSQKVVQVRGVSKHFGAVTAVSDLSFDLHAGEALALVGPNGAGKTTTLRMLATLLPPDSGEITIMGRAIADPFAVRPLLGYMPDVLGVYPEMLVREYLEFFARAYEIEERLIGYRMNEVVTFAGLESLLDTPAAGLSRGMLQRVALARALLHDPPLLLLDEPAAGLDPRSRVEFRHMLVALIKKGKSAIVSSHVLADLEDTCSRIAVIDQGRLLAVEPLDVFRQRATVTRTFRLRAAPPADRAHDMLAAREDVKNLRWEGEDLLFDFPREAGSPSQVLRALVEGSLAVEEFAEVSVSLEQAYLARTEAGA